MKIRQNLAAILVAGSLLMLFQNCSKIDKSNDSAASSTLSIEEKANFTWLNHNIIRPKCIECHSGSFAFSGLDFGTYDGVLDAVDPGNPDTSPLYTRSSSTTFFVLTEEEQEIIRTWILLGAAYD